MKICQAIKTTPLILCLLLTGCGELKGPAVVNIDTPPLKSAPRSSRIPPTQKPYNINGRDYYPIPSAQGFQETGLASWYGGDFHGRKTSNGETYNMFATTAAHKTLPMNTFLLVKNLENGQEMTVRVNDRGPFHKGRIIDLTKTGATNLGFLTQGTARVRITALGEVTTSQQVGVLTKKFKEHPDFQSGEFYVQIGSFIEENNANLLKKKMVAAGRKTVIQKFDRGDRIFYRVQIRAGTDLAGAERINQQLNETGFPDAFVVAR